MQILVDGLKMIRNLSKTNPLKDTLTAETEPGLSTDTDEKWADWVRKSVSTNFHPSSTCAMLPHDKGGVVDANLRVYGLGNVRVADASVPPIALSTHLMASTYGVAELASNIIREFHNGVRVESSPGGNSSDGPSGGGSGSGSNGGSNGTSTSSSGAGAKSSQHSAGPRSAPSPLQVWGTALAAVAAQAVVAFNSLL